MRVLNVDVGVVVVVDVVDAQIRVENKFWIK